MKVRCAFNPKHVIDTDHYETYRRVEGWEHPRSQGGTNHIELPERKEIYACKTCIKRIGGGIDPLQSTLV